jgi:superfamily II DNA or RNA helicase
VVWVATADGPRAEWNHAPCDLADIWAQFQQGYRRVCHVMPTAGGKTVVFVSLVAWLAAKGYRIVIVVHRQELVDQTCEALATVDLTFGVIASGHEENPDGSFRSRWRRPWCAGSIG